MHTLGVGVVEEQLDHVDVLGAGEGVAANANAERLAQSHIGGLRDGFVCQGAGAGHDANFAGLVDVTGLDTHLAAKGVNDARAVRANKARF